MNGCPTPVVMKEQGATITASPSRLEWAGLSGVFELFLGKSTSSWPEGGGGGRPGGLLVEMAEEESRWLNYEEEEESLNDNLFIA